MSKARARERAKAKAGQKKKRKVDGDNADQKNQHGQFAASATSIKSPGMKGGGFNPQSTRRGAARSR